MDSERKLTSKNERAERLLGRRPTVGAPIDVPAELGYRCPVCLNAPMVKNEFDERLHWSEYNGFLWCSVCDKDYPTCLCLPKQTVNIFKHDATEVFLDILEESLSYAEQKREGERCVWHKGKDEDGCVEWKAACGDGGVNYQYETDPLDFTFCPGCGKRIEVAP